MLESVSEEVTIEFYEGIFRRVASGMTTTRDRVILRGTSRAWDSVLVAFSAPRCNDVLAFDRHDAEFEIAEGRIILLKHLRVLLTLLQIGARTEGRSR